MSKKYYVALDDYERGTIINCLNEKRNKLIADSKYTDAVDEELKAACRALGGIPVNMGDIGFSLPVFDKMQVILKFYHSDEEFPASITLLWDENTLSFFAITLFPAKWFDKTK